MPTFEPTPPRRSLAARMADQRERERRRDFARKLAEMNAQMLAAFDEGHEAVATVNVRRARDRAMRGDVHAVVSKPTPEPMRRVA